MFQQFRLNICFLNLWLYLPRLDTESYKSNYLRILEESPENVCTYDKELLTNTTKERFFTFQTNNRECWFEFGGMQYTNECNPVGEENVLHTTFLVSRQFPTTLLTSKLTLLLILIKKCDYYNWNILQSWAIYKLLNPFSHFGD
jgi:hypothetical protein